MKLSILSVVVTIYRQSKLKKFSKIFHDFIQIFTNAPQIYTHFQKNSINLHTLSKVFH